MAAAFSGIAEDRKPWTAVVKRTGNGEVYLQSYRRAQLDEVMKWGDGWTRSSTGRYVRSAPRGATKTDVIRLRPEHLGPAAPEGARGSGVCPRGKS